MVSFNRPEMKYFIRAGNFAFVRATRDTRRKK